MERIKKFLQWWNERNCRLLSNSGFIPKDKKAINPVLQFGVLLACLAMVITSFMALGKISMVVFIYHYASLIYKVIITTKQNGYYIEQLKKCEQINNTSGTKHRVVYGSPFNLQNIVYFVVLIIITIGLFLVFIKVDQIEQDTVMKVSVILTTLLNTIKDFIDGTISIYQGTIEVE